jgi:hypothetical protein
MGQGEAAQLRVEQPAVLEVEVRRIYCNWMNGATEGTPAPLTRNKSVTCRLRSFFPSLRSRPRRPRAWGTQ